MLHRSRLKRKGFSFELRQNFFGDVEDIFVRGVHLQRKRIVEGLALRQ